MKQVIDLRSDTVTRPTAAMREAIARAEVGDDTLGDDPTTAELERRIASILGKEAAVFFPSGIMANEAALWVLAPRGSEIIVEANSHFMDWEVGAPAAFSGVQLRPVAGNGGLLDGDRVEAAIRMPHPLRIRTSVICLENTHNAAGGRILPLEAMRGIRAVADRHGLPIHLDGARLWNAAAATGTSEAEFAALADTVMVTLSKGLGCPVGSVLTGTSPLMVEARRARRRFGGGLRQAGLLAAAGLYALEHHRGRLAQDHARARRLAQLTGEVPGLATIPPETNIVMMEIQRPDLDSPALIARLAEAGLLVSEFTRKRFRAVTHLDVDDDAIERAGAILRSVLGN